MFRIVPHSSAGSAAIYYLLLTINYLILNTYLWVAVPQVQQCGTATHKYVLSSK